jgi:hypothetical protein
MSTRKRRSNRSTVPTPRRRRRDVKQVVKEMLQFRDREGPTLGGKATIRELIEESRRF